MGLLTKLFGKDWTARLDRAEALLEGGEPVRAMEIAGRASKNGDEGIRSRAEELVERIRPSLLETLLGKADTSESAGDPEDAADWVLAAIQHAPDEETLSELEARREDLLARAEENRNPFATAQGPEPGPDVGGDGTEGEIHYETLVATLDPEVAELYADRSERFRRAFIDLNQGRLDEAVAAFDELLTEDPGDPVLRLERGRARLALGDAEEAREDLEAAWEGLDDGPLDAVGSVSVPSLWAEAALASDDREAVLARLADLAEPARGRREICFLYATALVEAVGEGAIDYLGRAVRRFSNDPRFVRLLALQLAEAGRLEEGISVLESTVGPSCAGGKCGAPRKHLPSIRALADLYLREGERIERAGELMAIVAHGRGGRLTAEDHAVLATYYERKGDDEAAEVSRSEAERLAAEGSGAVSPPPLKLGGQRRVL